MVAGKRWQRHNGIIRRLQGRDGDAKKERKMGEKRKRSGEGEMEDFTGREREIERLMYIK